MNKKTLTILVLAIVILGAGAGLYVLNSKNKATFEYEQYSSFKLSGPEQGAGLAFDKPVELTKYSSSNDQVELLHQWKSGGKNGETYMAAASVTGTYTLPKNSIVSLDSQTITNIKKFVTDRMPLGWETKLGTQETFKNNYIKDNAWFFTFSSSKNQNLFEGEVIYVISGSEYYFFLTSSNKDNWQANTVVWDHITQSLKIDQ
ncbi:MAG TPA: hypothetical protein VFT49_02735 [Candidatus Saccharimonadales bacterium]|nr:hypothetical protein [Candidatus Saccharimonadales bacterium]